MGRSKDPLSLTPSQGETMNSRNQGKYNSLGILILVPLLFAAGCSTDSGSKKASAAPEEGAEYLSAADVRKDPDRVICKRQKPTGSRISEKVCMTARQWQAATDDSQRTLERAQRTTGGIDSN